LSNTYGLIISHDVPVKALMGKTAPACVKSPRCCYHGLSKTLEKRLTL
jgi:hypothetical protein